MMESCRGLPTGRRAIRLENRPNVSVVVASCRERSLLDECLKSLLPQATRLGAEIVVARTDDGTGSELKEAYPDIVFVSMPVGSAVPQLRAAGMAVSDGDIVALTEDHCIASDDWLDQLIRSHEHGPDVVGGSMGNAQADRVIDWAAYFSEYGFYARGGGGAEDTPLLTAANVAYKRGVVSLVTELAGRGEWENTVHQKLAQGGSTLAFAKAAAVRQNKSYHFWSFCQDRYVHGRDFARRRLVDDLPFRRWMYLAGIPVLPFLLTLRVARATGLESTVPFLKALPWTFAFLTAWSLGEAVGYLKGPLAPEAA